MERSLFLELDQRGCRGHTLDFSQLPPNYSVSYDANGNIATISAGTTTSTVRKSGTGGTDANLGGSTDWSFFDCILGSQGDDKLSGGVGDDTIYGDAPDSGFDTAASLLGSYANQVNTNTSGFQSPPIPQVLDNGQVADIWVDDATSGNDLDMTSQIRIANACGSWATGQIELNNLFHGC